MTNLEGTRLDFSMSDLDSSRKEYTLVATAPSTSLPKFDKSRTTAILSIFGLLLTWLAVVGCLLAAVLILKDRSAFYFRLIPLSTAAADATSFIINILVALFTDCLGFIHGTSLRWALYREGRLHFNTNIRLFNSARKSSPNRWPANLICIACLILCYAATSQLFLRGAVAYDGEGGLYSLFDYGLGDYIDHEYTYINGLAIAALGLGLMGQAVVATWCIFSTLKKTPTWSSNPLNNALALSHGGNTGYIEGCCMMSVHQQKLPAQKTQPQKRQKGPFAASFAVKYVLVLVWTLAILAIVWAVVIVVVSWITRKHDSTASLSPWHLTASWLTQGTEYSATGINDVPLAMDPYGNNFNSTVHFSLGVQILMAILFTCAIQGLQTIGLHCVELLVNISRDETVWRAAALSRKGRGAQLKTSALKSAASSWQNILLFLLKALLHWLLGQSLQASIQAWGDWTLYQFDMVYMRVFVFSIVATVLALFSTYLAFQKPKGPQPATWGHLHTIVNLVDDWGMGKGSLWWGDRGENEDGSRHAGTSADLGLLGEIRMGEEYAGI